MKLMIHQISENISMVTKPLKFSQPTVFLCNFYCITEDFPRIEVIKILFIIN